MAGREVVPNNKRSKSLTVQVVFWQAQSPFEWPQQHVALKSWGRTVQTGQASPESAVKAFAEAKPMWASQ